MSAVEQPSIFLVGGQVAIVRSNLSIVISSYVEPVLVSISPQPQPTTDTVTKLNISIVGVASQIFDFVTASKLKLIRVSIPGLYFISNS